MQALSIVSDKGEKKKIEGLNTSSVFMKETGVQGDGFSTQSK